MKKFKEELQKAFASAYVRQISENVKKGIREAKKRKKRINKFSTCLVKNCQA